MPIELRQISPNFAKLFQFARAAFSLNPAQSTFLSLTGTHNRQIVLVSTWDFARRVVGA